MDVAAACRLVMLSSAAQAMLGTSTCRSACSAGRGCCTTGRSMMTPGPAAPLSRRWRRVMESRAMALLTLCSSSTLAGNCRRGRCRHGMRCLGTSGRLVSSCRPVSLASCRISLLVHFALLTAAFRTPISSTTMGGSHRLFRFLSPTPLFV
nr:hypothetical protein [Tolivirales sp.]